VLLILDGLYESQQPARFVALCSRVSRLYASFDSRIVVLKMFSNSRCALFLFHCVDCSWKEKAPRAG